MPIRKKIADKIKQVHWEELEIEQQLHDWKNKRIQHWRRN